MPKRLLTVEAINERLKNAGISLEVRGKKLSLRAALTVFGGEGNKQARIPLSPYTNVSLDLEQAEAKAWELAACRTQGKFNWDNWLPSKGNEIANETPAAQVVEQYRQLKLQQGLKPEIWQRNY